MLRRVAVFLFADYLWITVVTILGAAAIYLLLPRPRAQKSLYGAALGCLVLLLAGATLIGPAGRTAETVLFYAFSAIAVASGALLVTQRNPARAALSFVLVVLSTCGLFLLLAAPFLMAATTTIYAGAIIVTFLFVLMLAQQEGPSDADYRSREPLLSAIAGFLLLGVLLYVLKASYDPGRVPDLLAKADSTVTELNRVLAEGLPTDSERSRSVMSRALGLLEEFRKEAEAQSTRSEYRLIREAKSIGDDFDMHEGAPGMREGMRDLLQQVRDRAADLPRTKAMLRPAEEGLSELSGPGAGRALEELRRDDTGLPPLPAENTAYLGRSLFTDYLLAVELGGTLLLVATVGAIAIAGRRSAPGVGRKQP
jgi:NADH:ubiquinone oxidoreductase subunit 6 (subunit J)